MIVEVELTKSTMAWLNATLNRNVVYLFILQPIVMRLLIENLVCDSYDQPRLRSSELGALSTISPFITLPSSGKISDLWVLLDPLRLRRA